MMASKNKNNFDVFCHSTDIQGRRCTISASTVQIDEKNCDVLYGVAICSQGDSFSKKIGRNIALGRAIKKPYKIEHIKISEGMFKEVLQRVYNLAHEIKENY